jgi:hypothetical protein
MPGNSDGGNSAGRGGGGCSGVGEGPGGWNGVGSWSGSGPGGRGVGLGTSAGGEAGTLPAAIVALSCAIPASSHASLMRKPANAKS